MKDLQRVLYVEDEQDIQVIVQVTLETIGGFKVKTCKTGYEAIAQAAEFAPDLILLDVMMPGMDGPGTMKALRQLPSLAEVPIAFVTAKIQHSEVNYYYSLGACGVICKPFDPMTLSALVQDIWDADRKSMTTS